MFYHPRYLATKLKTVPVDPVLRYSVVYSGNRTRIVAAKGVKNVKSQLLTAISFIKY